MEKYFTVEELSKYLSFAEKTIYKWVLNEEIPFLKINQTIRFRLSDIEKWLDTNKRGAASISGKTTNIDLPLASDVLTADSGETKQDNSDGTALGVGHD